MPRSVAALTILPFALVLALAVEVGIAGSLATPSSPRAVSSAHPTITEFASAPPSTAQPSTAQPSTAPPASGSNSADEMLRVHNELRVAISVPAVRGDDRVTTAAKRHAEYLARNGAIGHDETPGADGFTGATVRDRLAAQGYTDATASEVATSFGSGTDGVRSLWILPYHRLGLMHPHAIVAGWGHAESGARSATVGVIVYDFSSSAPDLVRSPAGGQRVQASWDGDESPDVLPFGAVRPVGYPVMLVASHANALELRSARLTDGAGREITYHVVPQLYEGDYAAIVPAQPLVRGSRYHVRFELRLSGTDMTAEWDFETEP
ncbi:MAG: hypothetical protein E6I57_03865 [Chloroflexi bacterium]|nr:MAG: hypothetical protein E6I57_03865 [Chloroflexota bacterium]